MTAIAFKGRGRHLLRGSHRSAIVAATAAIGLLCVGFPVSSSADTEEGRVEFGGSMRGRFETFRFSQDETGSKKDSRSRIRYRFRLDGKITINPRAHFSFRLVSGTDSRSGNVTLGDPVDFGPNTFSVRQAMMVWTPWPDGKLPDGKGYWRFDFGRVKNPFVWKGNGKDMMLWDGDIALAGIGTQFGRDLGSVASFFVNTGYYTFDEGGGRKDPNMTPVQVGVTGKGDKVRAGVRGSYWFMDQLDGDFISRGATGENLDGSEGSTSSGGNIPDGLTGDITGGTLDVVSGQAFVGGEIGPVPLVLFGGYSQNLSAEPSDSIPGVGKNDVAYNVGIEGGNKKKAILLGVAYYYIEANAFPSQFIDSDFLDGRTNRKGGLLYLSKQLMKNTDFNTQLFASDAIKTDNGLASSVKDSERVRLQVDLQYSF